MKEKLKRELLFFILVLIFTIFISVYIYELEREVFYYAIILFFLTTLMTLLFKFLKKTDNNKQKELERILYYNSLTKLPNKNLFLKYIELAKKEKDKYGVIVLDVKNFKEYTDKYGKQEADKLLINVSSTLLSIFSKQEKCANLYDDHFSILLKYNNIEEIKKAILNINSKVKEDNKNINLSFGVYLLEDRRFSANLILNKAEIACNSISNNFSSLYVFYNESLKKETLQISDIEMHMEDSIANNKFVVYYQPKYNIKRKKIISFESLVRWIHPTMGFLFPSDYVEIFKKNGFIKKMDFYVIENVCKDIKKITKSNNKAISISINIAYETLLDENVVEKINMIVDKYEVDHSNIEFEIPEEVLFNNIKMFIKIIKEFRENSYKIAIDNFGVGHSSKNIIKSLNVNTLKIDGIYLKKMDIRSLEVIINTIKTASELKLDVIATGIEERKQLQFLNKNGCKYGQGYYYSKPLTIKEICKIYKK